MKYTLVASVVYCLDKPKKRQAWKVEVKDTSQASGIRDVTDSKSEFESDGIPHFFWNPESDILKIRLQQI